MRTLLQQYQQAMAEHGIELTLAQACLTRAANYYGCRRLFMRRGVRCPTDDDAFQTWLGDSTFAWVIDMQCKCLAIQAQPGE